MYLLVLAVKSGGELLMWRIVWPLFSCVRLSFFIIFCSLSCFIFNIPSFARDSEAASTYSVITSLFLFLSLFPLQPPEKNSLLFHSVYFFVCKADLMKKLLRGFLSVSFLTSHHSFCVCPSLKSVPPNKNNMKLVQYTYCYIFSFFLLRCIPPAFFLLKIIFKCCMWKAHLKLQPHFSVHLYQLFGQSFLVFTKEVNFGRTTKCLVFLNLLLTSSVLKQTFLEELKIHRYISPASSIVVL